MKRGFLLLFLLIILSVVVNAQVLRVGMIDQDPDPVRAGDVVEVKFKLENLWDSTKYDVIVEAVPEYPLSIYESSTKKRLGRVDGTRYGADAVYFDFKFRVDYDAVDGEHEITLNVYDGETAWKLDNMFYIDIEKEEISLAPYIVASDLIIGGKKGSFTIEIANNGGTDIEALELKLLPSKDYRLLSTSDYIYLGDLEYDDTESEDFSVYVDEGVKKVSIPLQLSYEVDDKDYVEDFDLVLNLLTYKEAKKIGLVKQNRTPYIIGAIVILIVALLIVRRIRRR